MDVEPKENSDLLRKRNKIATNGNLGREELRGPPDGGIRAFAVLAGSFLTNGLLFGVINTYSVIYAELLKDLNSRNVTNAETRAGKLIKMTYIRFQFTVIDICLFSCRIDFIIQNYCIQFLLRHCVI